MSRRLGVWVVLVALAVAVPAAAGLRTSTGVSAWYDGEVPGSSFRLAPTVALDGSRLVMVGGAMLAGTELGAPYRGARLAGGWLFDPIERIPFEFRVSTAHRGGPDRTELGLTRAEARLHFAGPAVGGWMALATERAYGLLGQVADPLVGFGMWTRRNGLSLSLDLEQRAGVLPRASEPDSESRSPAASVSDGAMPGDRLLRVALTSTRATLRWQGSRLELESVGGVTLSLLREPKRWAQASAAYQVTPDLAMFATVGNRDPELYLIEPADSPSATMGLRLSQWRSASLDAPLVARGVATAWRARRADTESWTLEVRAPGARLVEVMGDFTRWEPLGLEHVGGDRWEATVILEPGVHQVNLRVDGGAWMPPPGAPTATDSYGGVTGVMVAE